MILTDRRRMLSQLQPSTLLRTNGKPFIDAAVLRLVMSEVEEGRPGILQPRRAMPAILALSEEADSPLLAHDLVITSCIKYNADPDYSLCGVYRATCGAARVIVKLFNEEFDWDKIDWESAHYDELLYTGCPELDAVHEIRSYRRMRALQGSVVPYSLGFYKVGGRLPELGPIQTIFRRTLRL